MRRADYEHVYVAYCTDHDRYHLGVEKLLIREGTIRYLLTIHRGKGLPMATRLYIQRALLLEMENDNSRT